MFSVEECVEGVLERARPTKSIRCDLLYSSRTATSIKGVTTTLGLSEIDSKIARRGATAPSGLSAGIVRIEMPPREKLPGHEGLAQRSKSHPSQSAKILLEDLFETNPPTISDMDTPPPVRLRIEWYILLQRWC